MAKQKNIETLIQYAFEQAFEKRMRMRDNGYVPLNKHTMFEIAKDSINFVRQESMAQLGDEIDQALTKFEQNMAESMDSWQEAARAAGGKDAVFPENTKFATCSENDSAIFIVEQKPQVRNIFSNYGLNAGGGDYYYNDVNKGRASIAFPYCVFGVHFLEGRLQRMTVCARNEPLNHLNDELNHLWIGNIYQDPLGVGVCIHLHDNLKLTLADRVNSAITQFWSTAFHTSKPHANAICQNKEPHKSLKSFAAWQEATKKDPNFILKVKWPKIGNGLTVSKLIEALNKLGRKYRDVGGEKQQQKVVNHFRPDGKKLIRDVQKTVFKTVAPEDYESDFIKRIEEEAKEEERKAEEAFQEREKEYKSKEKERKKALAEAKKKAKAEIADRVLKDLNNPMFKNRKGDGPRRGKKQCQNCGAIWGVRKEICDACAYDFKQRKVPFDAGGLEDALVALLPRRKAAKKRPKAAAAKKKVPKQRVKLAEPVKGRVKNIVKEAKNIIKAGQAQRAKVGKGKKQCVCGNVLGARVRKCEQCLHKFY
jgi:hypothetical protein